MKFLISDDFNTFYDDHTKSIFCAVVNKWFKMYPYEMYHFERDAHDMLRLKVSGENLKTGDVLEKEICIHETAFKLRRSFDCIIEVTSSNIYTGILMFE